MVGLDLDKVMIQIINTSNKTLEAMLKIHKTCKKSKHKIEEGQTKTRE